MDHVISYDLARGLHIIAVIAWIAGLLMLPRFYAYLTASQPGGELEAAMLKAARSLRTIILGPSMVLAWAFGLFLFATYIIGDWSRPCRRGARRRPALVLGQTYPCVRLERLSRLPICGGSANSPRASAGAPNGSGG